MAEFIEFSIGSPERFAALHRVFLELKHDKDSDHWRSTDEIMGCFDDPSLQHFSVPLDDERARRLNDLESRPIAITPTELSPGQTWDLDSLIHAFMNGDYELLRCEMVDDGKAQLSFSAFGYPYGGVGCMVALIEAFGGIITGIDDGAGFKNRTELTFESTKRDGHKHRSHASVQAWCFLINVISGIACFIVKYVQFHLGLPHSPALASLGGILLVAFMGNYPATVVFTLRHLSSTLDSYFRLIWTCVAGVAFCWVLWNFIQFLIPMTAAFS